VLFRGVTLGVGAAARGTSARHGSILEAKCGGTRAQERIGQLWHSVRWGVHLVCAGFGALRGTLEGREWRRLGLVWQALRWCRRVMGRGRCGFGRLCAGPVR
jgi:hypothetical protein